MNKDILDKLAVKESENLSEKISNKILFWE